jgi:cytochrome P450
MIRQRRDDPKAPDDLITGVARARIDDGTLLPIPEALAMIEQFLIAGNESSTRIMTSGILTLARRPELIEQLLADEKTIDNFVEEILRLNAPIQGFFRRVKKDVVLEGVLVPAGTMVMVRWASGNRDEAMFPRADELNLERKNARMHLSFGHGLHNCAGAQLARLELSVLFTEIVRGVRRVVIDQSEESISYTTNGIIFMGPSALRVRLDPRSEP